MGGWRHFKKAKVMLFAARFKISTHENEALKFNSEQFERIGNSFSPLASRILEMICPCFSPVALGQFAPKSEDCRMKLCPSEEHPVIHIVTDGSVSLDVIHKEVQTQQKLLEYPGISII